MTLDRYLEELTQEDRPLRFATIASLSDMSRAEVDKFAVTWGALTLERQRQLVKRLVEMAEENVELDFHLVFLMCLDSGDAEVRGNAILGLWEMEDRSLIEPLIKALTTDVSPQVRGAAAVALGKFAILAEEDKMPEADGTRVRDALMSVLRNENETLDVRRRALESIAPFESHVIREYIRRSYESDDLHQKSSAIFAMGRTGETRWLSYLFKEMRGISPVLRFEAANACGELGDESAVPQLIPLLDDDDLQVQLAAVRALGEIGGSTAMRALQNCVHSDESAIRDAAQEAIDYVDAMRNPLSFRYRA